MPPPALSSTVWEPGPPYTCISTGYFLAGSKLAGLIIQPFSVRALGGFEVEKLQLAQVVLAQGLAQLGVVFQHFHQLAILAVAQAHHGRLASGGVVVKEVAGIGAHVHDVGAGAGFAQAGLACALQAHAVEVALQGRGLGAGEVDTDRFSRQGRQ